MKRGLRIYFAVLWAALRNRPIISRCHLRSITLLSDNAGVLVIGNFVEGDPSIPPALRTPGVYEVQR